MYSRGNLGLCITQMKPKSNSVCKSKFGSVDRTVYIAGMQNPMKNYFGAKNGAGVYQAIINQIPPHKLYIEPFLGTGAILRKKKPAKRNIGIDLNNEVLLSWEQSGIPKDFEIYSECGINYLRALSTPGSGALVDSFIYIDPPYPITSRNNKVSTYEHELTDNQHKELLEIIIHLPGAIAISTYANKLYSRYLKDWRCIVFKSKTRTYNATEVLYMNYDTPVQLHDYRYLGNDMTDRQRIKRKIERKVKRLAALPPLEREAIVHGLREANLITNR